MRISTSKAWAAVALAGFFAAIAGCGGAGALGGAVAKGFVTYLEKVVQSGVTTYLLRRANVDTGAVTDLSSYAGDTLKGLLQGPSSTLYSVATRSVSDSAIVRLDTDGTTDVASVTGGVSSIASGPSGFVFTKKDSFSPGESIQIFRAPFSGGIVTTACSVTALQTTKVYAVAVAKASDSIYAAMVAGSVDSLGSYQLYRVTGASAIETVGPLFTGTIVKVAHAREATQDFLYCLEKTDSGVRLDRVSLADGTNEVLQTYSGGTADSMSADYDSEAVGFAIVTSGTRRVYQVSGALVTELDAAGSGDVTGLAFQ